MQNVSAGPGVCGVRLQDHSSIESSGADSTKRVMCWLALIENNNAVVVNVVPNAMPAP